MIKYLIFSLTALFLFSKISLAQNAKDSVLKIITEEVCKEISANTESFKNKEDLTTNLGLAFMPSFTKHQDELKELFGADLSNPSAMEELGRQVGIQLVTDCPQFIALFKNNQQSFMDIAAQHSTNKDLSGTLNGVLIKIVPGEFTYFVVKTASGKSEKILWQEYFKGSEKIANSNLNKPIKVVFVTKEIYNSTLKDYVSQKIATFVE